MVGLFGVFAWLYALGCGVVLWKALHGDAAQTHPGLVKSVLLQGSLAFALGLALLIAGWKLALRTGEYDAWDPKEPKMKF